MAIKKKKLPLTRARHEMRKVVIVVSGGVAEVVECPDDVTVEIIDEDE
jgi:hypothetical protein